MSVHWKAVDRREDACVSHAGSIHSDRRKVAAAAAANLLTTTPTTAISLASCRLPLSLDLSDLSLLFHAESETGKLAWHAARKFLGSLVALDALTCRSQYLCHGTPSPFAAILRVSCPLLCLWQVETAGDLPDLGNANLRSLRLHARCGDHLAQAIRILLAPSPGGLQLGCLTAARQNWKYQGGVLTASRSSRS